MATDKKKYLVKYTMFAGDTPDQREFFTYAYTDKEAGDILLKHLRKDACKARDIRAIVLTKKAADEQLSLF